MPSFRARSLDTSRDLPIHLNTAIATSPTSQQHLDKQFLHQEPQSNESFYIPIIVPVISTKELPYQVSPYEPPNDHYIKQGSSQDGSTLICFSHFMNHTHYDLDEDDLKWLESERQRMKNSKLEGEWRAKNIDINSPPPMEQEIHFSASSNKANSPNLSRVSKKSKRKTTTSATSNGKNKKKKSDGVTQSAIDASRRNGNSNPKNVSAALSTPRKQDNGNQMHTPSQSNGSSSQNGHATESHDALIDEDILEDIMDRYEKITGKARDFFPKMWDIEAHVPRKYARISNIKEIIQQIYAYWKNKRKSRRSEKYPIVGKPLLRHYQIPPEIANDDPRLAFRPRSKELEKGTPFPNNEEALRRLQLMRQQLERLHKIVWHVRNREKVHERYIQSSYEVLQQELNVWDRKDPSKRPVESRKRKREPVSNSSGSSSFQFADSKKKSKHTFTFDKVYRSFLEKHQKLYPQWIQVRQVDIPGSNNGASSMTARNSNSFLQQNSFTQVGYISNASNSSVREACFLDQWGTSIVKYREKISRQDLEESKQRKRRRIEKQISEWGTFSLLHASQTRRRQQDEVPQSNQSHGRQFANGKELGFEMPT